MCSHSYQRRTGGVIRWLPFQCGLCFIHLDFMQVAWRKPFIRDHLHYSWFWRRAQIRWDHPHLQNTHYSTPLYIWHGMSELQSKGKGALLQGWDTAHRSPWWQLCWCWYCSHCAAGGKDPGRRWRRTHHTTTHTYIIITAYSCFEDRENLSRGEIRTLTTICFFPPQQKYDRITYLSKVCYTKPDLSRIFWVFDRIWQIFPCHTQIILLHWVFFFVVVVTSSVYLPCQLKDSGLIGKTCACFWGWDLKKIKKPPTPFFFLQRPNLGFAWRYL